MRRMISEGASEEQLSDEAAAGSFTSMKQACRKLVIEGVTTAEEALKAINSTAE